MSIPEPTSKPLGSEQSGEIMFSTMHTAADDNYPGICREVGLACETCTSESARQLAAVCKGLRQKMIGQLFVQIYPHPVCARMHGHFVAHYLEAASLHLEEMSPAGIASVATAGAA
jgi:hypothetical protein